MSLGVRKKGSRLEGDGVVQLIVGFSAVRAPSPDWKSDLPSPLSQ
jgi:hypothetical protein